MARNHTGGLRFSTGLTVAALAAIGAAAVGGADKTAPPVVVPFGMGLPVSGQWREGFRLADMNGDGHLDVVHGPARKRPGPPCIFLGDGKGAWKRWTEARFPDAQFDYGDIEVADFNGDGFPDLALAIHLHGLRVLLGDGRGNFTDASQGLGSGPAPGAAFSSRAIRAVDWNVDGRPDLAAVWEGPQPGGGNSGLSRFGRTIFLNQGAAGWKRLEPGFSPGVFSDSLALGDIDGDGHQDLATGSMMLGRKDLVTLWTPAGPVPVTVDLPGPHHYVYAVSAGDFDGDNRSDLAVAHLSLDGENWAAFTDLFYSRPNLKWERRNLFRGDRESVAVGLAHGHLRTSGKRDLVAVTARGETMLYLNDGNGKFAREAEAIPVFDGGCRGSHVELADLDGDGRDEIVTAFADEAPAGSCPSGGGMAAWKLAAADQESRHRR